MKIEGPLLEAQFMERPNRFLARVMLRGGIVDAHLRDPGRLEELLVKGRIVYIRKADGPQRKTHYNLFMVRLGEALVSIDSTLPNQLIYEELIKGDLGHFKKYREIHKEARFGNSRFDFLLKSRLTHCYLEVKSVTLVMGGIALFPDAVTARGARHMQELLAAHKEGHEAYVVFVVQREDACCLAPHDETDPAFGQALRAAMRGGVKALAFKCKVTSKEIKLGDQIEVKV